MRAARDQFWYFKSRNALNFTRLIYTLILIDLTDRSKARGSERERETFRLRLESLPEDAFPIPGGVKLVTSGGTSFLELPEKLQFNFSLHFPQPCLQLIAIQHSADTHQPHYETTKQLARPRPTGKNNSHGARGE